MTMAGIRRLVVLLVLVLCAVIATAHEADAGLVGGTTISNVASATFSSSNGLTEMISSNSVTTVVASIGALVVSPKQAAPNVATDSFPTGSPVVRTFTISNTSNISDAYIITALTASGARVTSIAYVTSSGNVPITIGSTISPTITPGGSIQVVVTLATVGVAIGTQISIDLTSRTTVTTTANGVQSDNGQLWAVAAVGPKFDGPNGATTIEKYVQNAVTTASAPGSTVTYTILFKNDGGAQATNTVLTDAVPVGVHAQLATVKINGTLAGAKASLNAQTLTVAIGTVPAATSMTVSFDATVDASSPPGSSLVNIASVSADGITATNTAPAVVLIGFSNIVYDGYDGQKHPVGGAVVSLVDDTTGVPVTLTAPNATSLPVGGANVNPNNTNPFTTSPDGVYAFYFTANQLSASSIARSAQSTAKAVTGLDLIITAPNYTHRRIGVTITQSATSPLLYDVTLVSKDGMPLATAGGFTLVETGVSLTNVFGILGNIPLFAPRPITITKVADRSTVSAGDRVVFTLQYTNAGNTLGQTSVIDTLPAGLAYAPGTGRVDGARVEPTIDGRTLTWSFPSLDSNTHTITYATVVIPGVQENTILTNVATIRAQPVNVSIPIVATARAEITIVAGVLSEHVIITGRVYLSRDGADRFHRGDIGIPNVRIYLEDGESVSTDTFGRYSFPSVRPGMHALRLDTTTLPRGVGIFAVRGDDDRSPERLVHGIMDSSLIQDINFALAPVKS